MIHPYRDSPPSPPKKSWKCKIGIHEWVDIDKGDPYNSCEGTLQQCTRPSCTQKCKLFIEWGPYGCYESYREYV